MGKKSSLSSSSATTKQKPRRYFYSTFHVVGAFLMGCCVATVGITIFHFSTLSDLHDGSVNSVLSSSSSSLALVHHTPGNVAKSHSKTANDANNANNANNNNNNNNNSSSNSKQKQKLASNHDNLVHPVAGLDCSEHDGPMDADFAKEMVYWRDIAGDNSWKSPFLQNNNNNNNNNSNNKNQQNKRQYLTFEPDGGGWNNIRMSMETVLTLALAMGRVLVLPPSQKMYLLGKTTFNFADFFPLQELAEEHASAGFEIITTEQFLIETMGSTTNQQTQTVSYPPENKKTAWDGDTSGIKTKLAPWIRSIATMPDWDPSKCIAAFPKSTDPQDTALLRQEFNDVLAEQDGLFASNRAYPHYLNKPIPVTAASKDRLREFLAERKQLCVYDTKLQNAPIIHFHGKANKSEEKQGGRLLVHFYAFLFFQDYHTDLWMKRFVRDHVRYIDNIQCAAARIVHKLRTIAINDNDNVNNNNNNNAFDSFHIRRGDFQYKNTRVDASVIVDRSKDVIEKGRVVYVGTDERNKNFFQPLRDQGWKVFFLDDFLDEVGASIDPHYYGMIDQLVVSRGERFFGCWFSTFTGYIMRLRGYHSQSRAESILLRQELQNQNQNQIRPENDNGNGNGGGPDATAIATAEAFAQGKLPNSYYYALEESKTKMHDYWPIKKSFYAREFPASWRQLDVK